MKKSNSNKNIIITLIIVIIVVVTVTITVAQRNGSKKMNPAQSVINDSVGFFDRVAGAPIRGIKKGVFSVRDLFVTYDENKSLKSKIDTLGQLEAENQSLKQENEQMRKELDLGATLSSYEKIHATVIDRSPDAWQDVLIINRGSKDGVEVNMAVMGDKGLIGRVIEANTASAKVELLTSSNQNSNHFPIQIMTENDEKVYGLLERYDKENNTLIVSQLTGDNIAPDSKVTTSGLGGNSPANLFVGEVIEVKKDRFAMNTEAYIRPAANMYDNSVVTVIKGLVGTGE